MKCWYCGVEPVRLVEVTTLGSSGPQYLPGGWPAGVDHEHAVRAPSPSELTAAGHRALMRIRDQAIHL